MRRPSWLIAFIAVSALTAPAMAGPLYTIHYNNGGEDVSSTTGFRRDTTFALAPSNGSGVFTGGAYAGPRLVTSLSQVNCTWESGSSGSFSGGGWARVSTDDFIITGPGADPTYVPGTLHVRVRIHFDRTGGFADNNGHGGLFAINVSATYAGTFGTLISGNFNTSGSGCFSGVTEPSVDLALPLSGSFRVNVPFTIQMFVESQAYTYGSMFVSPGMSMTDGDDVPGGYEGLTLEAVDGQILTVPAGYTFSSTNWGIANNTVGVGEMPAASGLRLELAGSNPSSGPARLRLTLPHDARAHVVLYDLAGRAVRELLDGWQTAGSHDLTWDGRDAHGAAAAAGLYLVRADLGGVGITKRIVHVR